MKPQAKKRSKFSSLKFAKKHFLVFLFSILLTLNLTANQEEITMTNSTNPSLGMGLGGISDWSTQLPFINHFKSSRPWIGHEPRANGGYNWGGVSEEEFVLDENGYPISLPVVNGKTAAMGTVLFTNMEAEEIPGGKYIVLYDGEGTIDYHIRAEKIESESTLGRDVVEFTPEGNTFGMRITETDPNNTGDYIRNIRVVREDQLDLYEAGATFNPKWLEKIEDFRSLRFMDWMETNHSEVSEWRDRATLDDASWMEQAPIEVMIELANQTGTDPWFNIPHQATDEFIRNFAEIVKEQLDPDLKAHFEFSNEVWNWGFEQSQYALEQAQELWGDVNGGWMQWYGMRSAQMAQILDEVYGEQADDRLVKVIATQTSYRGLENYILESPEWVAQGNPAPHTFFDAYAITGYFGRELGLSEDYNEISTLMSQDREGAFDLAFQKLDGYLSDKLNDIQYQSGVAQEYGLDLVAYEGGTHVVGVNGQAKNDDDYTDFLIELNRRPEMGALYEELLQGWQDAGGTLFQHFVDVGVPSKHGSWGALSHLNDSTPRWTQITNFNETNSGWRESRPDGTFDQGLILEGDDGNNVLVGTVEEDFLIGGAGDDLLEPEAGNDGINGGDGIDTIILDQIASEYTFSEKDNGLLIESAEGSNFVVQVEFVEFADGTVVEMDLEQLQSLSNSTTDSTTVSSPDLITAWSFEEINETLTSDSSGNNHEASLVNGVMPVEGIMGNAINFDGEDDLVRGLDNGTDLNGLDAITVSVWVKSDQVGTDQGIFSTVPTNGHDSHLGMRYDDKGASGGGDDVIKLALTTTEGKVQYESSSFVQTTEWQHLAMVWESGNSPILYINGELDTPTKSGWDIGGKLAEVSELTLGQSQRSSDLWDGAMDEFRVYDQALSSDEIASLASPL